MMKYPTHWNKNFQKISRWLIELSQRLDVDILTEMEKLPTLIKKSS